MAKGADGAVLARLSGACKRYGEIAALDGLDLEVRQGELLAVLGPNGAGKTTAIALLLGLQRPDAGEVLLFGRPPHDLTARRGVGVMMQEVARSWLWPRRICQARGRCGRTSPC